MLSKDTHIYIIVHGDFNCIDYGFKLLGNCTTTMKLMEHFGSNLKYHYTKEYFI